MILKIRFVKLPALLQLNYFFDIYEINSAFSKSDLAGARTEELPKKFLKILISLCN